MACMKDEGVTFSLSRNGNLSSTLRDNAGVSGNSRVVLLCLLHRGECRCRYVAIRVDEGTGH